MLPLRTGSARVLQVNMPRDKGFGRKKKKMKAATEVEVEVGAGGEVEVSIVVSPRPKRTRQSRKKAPAGPTPLQPPPFAGVATFERAAEAVREAAAALEKACFVCELAEERHRRQLAKGVATLQRLRKLREKQGERSAKWSRGWMNTMDELDAEETKLDGELQLRLDEVAPLRVQARRAAGALAAGARRGGGMASAREGDARGEARGDAARERRKLARRRFRLRRGL